MPSREELARIVEEMRSQGLGDDEIRETLEDMGVSSDAIASLLGGTPGKPEEEPAPSPPPRQSAPSSDDLFPSTSQPKDVLSSLLSSEQKPLERPAEPSPPPSPKEEPPKEDFSASITTPPILEEESVPSEKLDEIHTKVDALHKTLSSASLRDDVVEIKEMLRELKKEIREVKAMFLAIQKILQEILDTDRSILVDLYERSKK